MRRVVVGSFVVVALAQIGCGAVLGNPKKFEKKIPVACETRDGCERIKAVAHERKVGCKQNTIGYVDCGDAQRHLGMIEGHLNRFREHDRAVARQQEERARVERDQERQEARQRREREREEKERSALDAEWASLDQPLCEQNGDRRACDAIKWFLRRHPAGPHSDQAIAVLEKGKVKMAERQREEEAEREEEEKRRAAERRIRATSTPQPTGGGMYKCCDGSSSPSCECGGPRRGCCSHHGGICGCD